MLEQLEAAPLEKEKEKYKPSIHLGSC
uniref:Uncharacterized protein n=1 Tax=Arundo donax TaxID=35708 RepID=A0A0A8ZL76_ARUDO